MHKKGFLFKNSFDIIMNLYYNNNMTSICTQEHNDITSAVLFDMEYRVLLHWMSRRVWEKSKMLRIFKSGIRNASLKV